MELRVTLQKHAQRRLNLLEVVRRPVRDWKDASEQWLALRGQYGMLATDTEHVRVHDKETPVAVVSWGGALWSFEDQDLPIGGESVCLHDPLGVNTRPEDLP